MGDLMQAHAYIGSDNACAFKVTLGSDSEDTDKKSASENSSSNNPTDDQDGQNATRCLKPAISDEDAYVCDHNEN